MATPSVPNDPAGTALGFRANFQSRVATAGALALIVAVALFLRWQRLEYTEFTNDQAWVLNRAYDFVSGHGLPLSGVTTSMGAIQGPWEVYLLSLPVAFSTDPKVATAFVGLLQVIAILGTYLVFKRYFGFWVGLIAAALFATNPWALQYSRKIWTPNLLPVFSVALQALLLATLVDRKRWAMAAAMPILAIMFLIHPSAIVFGPIVALVFVVRWRVTTWKPVLVGTVLALLVTTPTLIYESGRNFYSVVRYWEASAVASAVDFEAVTITLAMASARYFPAMMGYSFRGEWGIPTLALQDNLASGLVVLGLAVCAIAVASGLARRRSETTWLAYLVPTLWFLVPVVWSLRHSLALNPHYFIGVYPAQFVLIALGLYKPLAYAVSRFGQTTKAARFAPSVFSVAFLLFVTLPQIDLVQRYLDVVETHTPKRPYGVPLRYSQEAAQAARDLAAEHSGAPVYFVSYRQYDVLSYLGRFDMDTTVIDPPEGLLLPRDTSLGAIYVLSSDDGYTASKDYHLVADDGPAIARLKSLGFTEDAERAVRANDGYVYFRLFYASPDAIASALAAFGEVPGGPALANRVQLRGQRLPPSAVPGESVELATLWGLPDAESGNPDQDINLFAHLRDRAGGQVAQNDAEMVLYRVWRESDVALIYHEVTVPDNRGPGLLWFDVGAYGRYKRDAIPWLDAGGRATNPTLKLGPLVVRPEAPTTANAFATAFRFGTGLELVGFDLDTPSPGPGGTAEVTLRWRANGEIAGDYVVSAQLLDQNGVLVAQHDSPPVSGEYPTTSWLAGEVVDDRHVISLPAETAPGQYSLLVVVYDRETVQRLVVTDAGGKVVGDAATLSAIAVN